MTATSSMGSTSFVLYYDDDLSYKPSPTLAHAKLMEITSFKIKPGHDKQWHELANLVIDAHNKAGDSAHWGTFEVAYGGGDEYIVFSDDKSMADIDTGYAEDKKFHDALGDDGLKKLRELVADCASIARIQSCLPSIPPKAIHRTSGSRQIPISGSLSQSPRLPPSLPHRRNPQRNSAP